MRVNQFHSGGMYEHNALEGVYILVNTVLYSDDLDSYEITFDIKKSCDDSLRARNQLMVISTNDLYKWSQRGVC